MKPDDVSWFDWYRRIEMRAQTAAHECMPTNLHNTDEAGFIRALDAALAVLQSERGRLAGEGRKVHFCLVCGFRLRPDGFCPECKQTSSVGADMDSGKSAGISMVVQPGPTPPDRRALLLALRQRIERADNFIQLCSVVRDLIALELES